MSESSLLVEMALNDGGLVTGATSAGCGGHGTQEEPQSLAQAFGCYSPALLGVRHGLGDVGACDNVERGEGVMDTSCCLPSVT